MNFTESEMYELMMDYYNPPNMPKPNDAFDSAAAQAFIRYFQEQLSQHGLNDVQKKSLGQPHIAAAMRPDITPEQTTVLASVIQELEAFRETQRLVGGLNTAEDFGPPSTPVDPKFTQAYTWQHIPDDEEGITSVKINNSWGTVDDDLLDDDK